MLTAEHCDAATHDRRIRAAHDAEIGNGAQRFGVSQRQRKSGPIGQFPASIRDALAHLLCARRPYERCQDYRCECEYRNSRCLASRAGRFSDWTAPVVSTWPYVLHKWSTRQRVMPR